MAASNGIMAALREHTRPEHQALETMLPLGRSTLSLRQLCECLARFYGFYVPWEQRALSTFATADPGFLRSRSKVALLEADLAHLGRNANTIPRCTDLPALDSVPAVLGSMYVLEGATLGGQLISRNIEATLPLRFGEGYSFFRSYGDDVGARWRDFGARVQLESTAANATVILDSARSTFRSLIRWFGL